MDVIELRNFYFSSLGQMARRMIRRQLRLLWGNVTGLDVVAMGYATPFVRPFRDEARRTIALMPAAQGVVHWPEEGASLAALVSETELPLPDASIDRLLLVHGLEHADTARALLREIWRVLAPEGRLLVVVPHRRSPWAARENTPFGYGHAYSASQLSALLTDCLFAPGRPQGALFFPPFGLNFFIRTAGWWERVGRILWPGLGGVLLLEATKRIYAAVPPRAGKRVLVPATAAVQLAPAAKVTSALR